jgi:hypothetical protein
MISCLVGKKMSNFTLKNRLKMQVTGNCATQPGVLQHSFSELEGHYWFLTLVLRGISSTWITESFPTLIQAHRELVQQQQLLLLHKDSY